MSNQLQRHGKSVFKDDVDTQAGQHDWGGRLKHIVRRCECLVVVIGSDWLTDKPQIAHLHDPKNWVRQEILLALELRKKIIPVVMNGAEIPDIKKLPEELQPLIAEHQAFKMSEGSTKFHQDTQKIVAAILDRKNARINQDTLNRHTFKMLDRVSEIDQITSAFDNHSRVYAVTASREDYHESFVYRCQSELERMDGGSYGITDSAAETAVHLQVQRMQWSAFSEITSPERRKEKMLRDVIDTLGQQGNQTLSDYSALSHYLSSTQKPTLFVVHVSETHLGFSNS